MVKIGAIGSVLAMILGGKPAPKSATPPAPIAASGDAAFATSLFQRLARQPGNLFFSPAGIRMAMAMTYAGARGNTATEMERTLALAPGNAGHAELGAQLERWDALAKPTADRSQSSANESAEMRAYYEDQLERRRVILRVVNRIWAQSGHPLRPELVSLLSEVYRAPAAQLDFKTKAEPSRAEINKWVADNTAGKIPELIGKGLVKEDTRLVLTNAVYFKARWKEQFKKEMTKSEPFFVSAAEKVSAPLMHQTDRFNVGAFSGGQVLELPYGQGDLSMLLVVPSKVDGLPAIEKQFAEGALPQWIAAMKNVRAEVYLPRFKVSASFSLGAELKALGMIDAFRWPGADFSGIDGTKDLLISEVVHQAIVEVDELGTEAAAATAVMMMAGAMRVRDKPVVVRADRPFLFLIRDTKTGVLLFAGRLCRPGA